MMTSLTEKYLTICLRLVEEECAGSGVVRWVGLLSQFCNKQVGKCEGKAFLQHCIKRLHLEKSESNESSRTIWELPVADVLQVGPGVFTHVLSGGDGTLLQLHFSPVDLGTLSRRDAARH